MILYITRYDNGEDYEDHRVYDTPFETYLDAYTYAVNFIHSKKMEEFKMISKYTIPGSWAFYGIIDIIKYNTEDSTEEIISEYSNKHWKHGEEIDYYPLNIYDKFRQADADYRIEVNQFTLLHRVEVNNRDWCEAYIGYKKFCRYTIAKYHFDMAICASDKLTLNPNDDAIVQIRAEYWHHKHECLKYISEEIFNHLHAKHIETILN